MRMRGRLASVLFLMTLSACFGHSSGDDLYVLAANTTPLGCVSKTTIHIIEPETAPGLDSSRITIFDTPNHINYYTGAKWVQPLPQMTQAFFVNAFTQSHAFKNVTGSMSSDHSDVNLIITINHFEVEGTGSPVVHIALIAKVINNSTHKIMATIPFEKTYTPSQNHMHEIVDAFNQGLNEAAANILQNMQVANSQCKYHSHK